MDYDHKVKISDLIEHLQAYIVEHGDKFILCHQRSLCGWYLDQFYLDLFITQDELNKDCVNIDDLSDMVIPASNKYPGIEGVLLSN